MRSAELHGSRLLAARAAWITFTVLLAGFSVTLLLEAYGHYPSACAECRPFWRLAPKDMLAVRELGVSVGFYAAYGLAIEMIYLLGFWVVGAAIFWRKIDDRLAFGFSLVLVIFGALNAINLSVEIHPALELLDSLFSFVAFLTFFAYFYVFPNGRFVPRWTRWMVIAWALYLAALFFSPEDSPFYPATWPLPLTMVFVVALFGSMVFAQVYRYRRVSGSGERQQTKWVVFGLTAAIVGVFFGSFAAVVFGEVYRPGAPRVLYALFELTVNNFSLLLIPLSIGIAILRYRLWDIDIIIKRTLVYGSLTATLIALYFGAIVVLQRLFVILTGQKSTLAVVASTLVIAALFNPLRRRIKEFIDRSFYRRRYDTRKTLEAFSTMMRDETDLDALKGDLVGVVRETMQPEHVSLWLHPDSAVKDKKRVAIRESGHDE
jgi:hypothetical protein